MRSRVATLGHAAEHLSLEVERLQVAESGGLAINQMMTLHDTWKDVMRAEMEEAEKAAATSGKAHAASTLALRRREDDLVLMISRWPSPSPSPSP